jgi:hypothetical protein
MDIVVYLLLSCSDVGIFAGKYTRFLDDSAPASHSCIYTHTPACSLLSYSAARILGVVFWHALSLAELHLTATCHVPYQTTSHEASSEECRVRLALALRRHLGAFVSLDN